MEAKVSSYKGWCIAVECLCISLESGGTKRATSVPAESGWKFQDVSQNQACTGSALQAQKSHVHGSRMFGALWDCKAVRA